MLACDGSPFAREQTIHQSANKECTKARPVSLQAFDRLWDQTMGKESTNRRRFIGMVLGAIAAAVAIASAGAAGLWWWLTRSREAVFRRFARLRDLSINQPKLVSIPESPTTTGAGALQISVWLVRRNENAVDAYSIVCPHAGGRLKCDESEFFCPKHGARFDMQGHRLKADDNGRANPAPRDMDSLPVQCVMDDADGPFVEVKYQQFLIGTPKQVAVPRT
jgi:nitrite reductase/ring-hydroxylating ferredoxin subunit